MTSGPDSATFAALVAAGLQPEAVEAGRRWAAPDGGHPGGLLVVGGDATDRATFLRALAREARLAGREARFTAVVELSDAEMSEGPAGALLIPGGDALADHPDAAALLVSRWEVLAGAGVAISLSSESVLDRLSPDLRELLAGADVAPLDEEEGAAGGGLADEFGDFLADVSTVVAGLLDEEPAAEPGIPEDDWLGAAPPELSLVDFVSLRGADSVGARIARKVLTAPGTGYNPLTVWAEPGAGRTTLLAAIARAYRERHPEHRVAFLAAEGRRMPERDELAQADLLVIDDIEDSGDLEAITAAVVAARGQVIVSSARPGLGRARGPRREELG
jgi:hypothetical protein